MRKVSLEREREEVQVCVLGDAVSFNDVTTPPRPPAPLAPPPTPHRRMQNNLIARRANTHTRTQAQLYKAGRQ